MVQFQQEEQSKRRLTLLRQKEEEESVKILAEKYKIPPVDLTRFPIETDALQILPEQDAREAELAVFQQAGRRIGVAVRSAQNDNTKSALARLGAQFTYDLYLASSRSLERAWALYQTIKRADARETGAIQLSQARIDELQKEITGVDVVKKRIVQSALGRITDVLEVLVAGALATDASDVHIEPQEEHARIRYRLDGVLYDIGSFSHKAYQLLLSRIKLVSELKLNIRDRAQDGRFTIRAQSADVEVRTSTLPGPYGENVVLRILNPKSIRVTFQDLGMQPWMIAAIDRELKKPNGMIVTTGPTGSGKTTTLYAFVQKVHEPGIKIITIEDPIEYHLSGIEQTQVDRDKGYDFAGGLRAIVRQDPDVILVGEIRDRETAEIAMHASLTGHLVFSTLHTNNAAATIPRLIDLGIKASTIGPAINAVIAQRLLRKLCPKCMTQKTLTKEEEQAVEKELAALPKNIPAPHRREWRIMEARTEGCAACGATGYKGRTSIFELILVDAALEDAILKEPSEREIKKAAADQGQTTMRQDAVLKVLAGITDFLEIERVLGEE